MARKKKIPRNDLGIVTIVLHIIPFTSAYLLVGDLLVGNITVVQGCLYLGLLIFFSILMLLLASKIYKSRILKNGK